ncbi:Aristolochene synthase in complex with 12,13 Difluorofarnesyl diphosphate [Massarina eburnea CBS 473.64]|uniref:Terpene synthase n=1 Tax=Massarina eburnea CBS 473.64 TaxID=1395130 RepID=A0A6A6RUZ8_9PLEO|nr:Aristolochene synthase in complex with 12,13 Difluorofarnesyl diphosphate [Massarina eburnea CBS 473.64]
MGSVTPSQDIVSAWNPKPSNWTSRTHSLIDVIKDENTAWFFKHWPFPDEKAKKKFVDSRWDLLCSVWYPLSIDDRFVPTARLIVILFYIDDALEDLSFADGEAYNNRLMDLALRKADHDASIPLEYMWHDIWESMSALDAELAEAVKEPVFVFLRATTDRERGRKPTFGAYLKYREGDVGQQLLAALVRFSMGLHLTPEEFEAVGEIDRNSARHIGVVNDIFSWEKEYRKSIETAEEGAILSNAVQVFGDEVHIPYSGAKNVLLILSREWENVHDELSQKLINNGASSDLQGYLKGLELVMSGNEYWSRRTPRYH